MTGHRWPIRYQLATILVVPLLALTVAGIRQGLGGLARATDADRVRAEAGFAVAVSTLVHELQRERGLSGGYVGSKLHSGGPAVAAQRERADTALGVFDEQADNLRLDAAQENIRISLESARRALRGLAEQRRAVDGGDLDVTQTLAYYTETINKLLAVDGGLVDASDDREATQLATAFVHLSQAKEFTALERGFMNSVFSAGHFAAGDYTRLLSIIAAQDAWRAQFRAVATPEQLAHYDATVAGPDVETAAEFRKRALAEGRADQALSVDNTEWWAAMTSKIDLVREVELELASNLEAYANQTAEAARGAAIRDMVIAFVVVALSLALSLFTARRMARSLGRLRDAALDAADKRLPAVVARLGDGEDVDIDSETAPVGISSLDEIGDTANAFNRVHKVALELTVQQAGMRRNLGDTLLNLARRSQALVHQQIELIDDLERGEQDATQLQALFRLDHLATRMRRHTEDLIVLSGAAPSRAFSQPVPLRDVIRGAIAEVEHYSRVRTARAPDVTVRGHVVGDLVHLLAELIENATRFSPPQTPVQVTAGEVGNGYVIDVEDRGLGMAEADISRYNERFADPPAFDLTTSDRLGLYVVGRLAARHGIRVRLRGSVYGGVTAVVLLHAELLDRISIPPTTTTTNMTKTAGTTGAAGNVPLERDTVADGTPDPTLLDRHNLAAGRQPAALAPSGHLRVPFAGQADARDMQMDAQTTQTQTETGPRAPARRLPTQAVPTSAAEEARFRASDPPPASPDAVAALGLPRRVPKQHLADGLRRTPAAPSAPFRPAHEDSPKPSPEEIKKMLSGYQSGFDRGWEDTHGRHRAPGSRASGAARNHDRATFGGEP